MMKPEDKLDHAGKAVVAPPLTSIYDAMIRIGRLESALRDLVGDLEERSKFDPDAPGVVACSDGVYKRAKALLGEPDDGPCQHCNGEGCEACDATSLYGSIETAPKDGSPVYELGRTPAGDTATETAG